MLGFHALGGDGMLQLVFLQEMCALCLTPAFQWCRADPGHWFSLCGMAGATGFGEPSPNPALGLQRKEGGVVVKVPPLHGRRSELDSSLCHKKKITVDFGCVSYTLCWTTVPPSVKMWKIFTYLAEDLITGTRGTWRETLVWICSWQSIH